jgi:type IV pilus assembly protein PilV
MNTRTANPRVCGSTPRRAFANGGFTLVEVLITAAVTIVAFTGLATMQMLTLRAADSTLKRSQATALAYEMVDRMRLNRGESGLSGTALGGAYDNYTLCNPQSLHGSDTRTCSIGALADMTAQTNLGTDLRAWWTALNASRLPHWYAGIARSDATFTVAVQWDDARAESPGEHASATATSCLSGTMPSSMQEVCVMTQL